jgi:hypothetical protein
MPSKRKPVGRCNAMMHLGATFHVGRWARLFALKWRCGKPTGGSLDYCQKHARQATREALRLFGVPEADLNG